MAQVNRYFRFAKISEAKFRTLSRCFALDLSATQTAEMTGISLRSVNPIYLRLRQRLARECEQHSPFKGSLEPTNPALDHDAFGAGEAAAPDRKPSSSVCGKERTWSTQKSFPMSPGPRSER